MATENNHWQGFALKFTVGVVAVAAAVAGAYFLSREDESEVIKNDLLEKVGGKIKYVEQSNSMVPLIESH